MNSVDLLNRRLGESLGLVCGGTMPRFAWKYAPDQPYFVYARDNRTLIRKCWADLPAPGGGTLGKVWLMAEWKRNRNADHCGFGSGLRIAVARDFAYTPYLETALVPGLVPTDEINQNYIWALDYQLQRSAEFDPDSEHNYMAEEKYTADRNKAQHAKDWHEFAASGYDDHTGAFGNCLPGTAGGFLSFGGM